MSKADFSEGYQEALDDLASAYRTGGLAGLLTWAADNARDESTRAGFAAAATTAAPAPASTVTAPLNDLALGDRVLHLGTWTTITSIIGGGWAGWRLVRLDGFEKPLHVTLSERFIVERKP